LSDSEIDEILVRRAAARVPTQIVSGQVRAALGTNRRLWRVTLEALNARGCCRGLRFHGKRAEVSIADDLAEVVNTGRVRHLPSGIARQQRR
jgi:hypothetical protein